MKFTDKGNIIFLIKQHDDQTSWHWDVATATHEDPAGDSGQNTTQLTSKISILIVCTHFLTELIWWTKEFSIITLWVT